MMGVAQVNVQSRRARVVAKWQFHLLGLELVLAAQPAHDRLDKILQRLGQGAGQEARLLAGLEEAIAVTGHQTSGDPTDALAGVLRGDVAPAFVLAAQLVVKERQYVVLKASLFLHVQLEKLSLLGAQAGMNKEL